MCPISNANGAIRSYWEVKERKIERGIQNFFSRRGSLFAGFVIEKITPFYLCVSSYLNIVSRLRFPYYIRRAFFTKSIRPCTSYHRLEIGIVMRNKVKAVKVFLSQYIHYLDNLIMSITNE